jgi:hypothetical protein
LRTVESSVADPIIFGSLEFFNEELPCNPSIFGALAGFNSPGVPSILELLDPFFDANGTSDDLPLILDDVDLPLLEPFPYMFFFERMLPSWFELKPAEPKRLLGLGPFKRSNYVDTIVQAQKDPTSWQATLSSCLNDTPHYQVELNHQEFQATSGKSLSILGTESSRQCVLGGAHEIAGSWQ